MSEKTKARIRNIVFSRFFITAILLILQIWLLLSFYVLMKEYSKVGIVITTGIGIILIIYMVNSSHASTYKAAWILILAVFPVFGTLLYIYTKINIGAVKSRKILKEVLDESSGYTKAGSAASARMENEASEFKKLASYIENVGGYPAWTDTKVTYYPIGDDVFEPILEAIRSAKEFIFLEFFIVEAGRFWDCVLEALEEKAKEGVEVRMLYDDMGCIVTLPRNYYNELRKKGINSRAYAEMLPFLSTHYNNRDHRKILVVDNKVAFTGGINLSDEYINAIERFGTWKDTMVRLEGKGVGSFTLMFLQMWNSVYVQYRSPEMYIRYLGRPEGVEKGIEEDDEKNPVKNGIEEAYKKEPEKNSQPGVEEGGENGGAAGKKADIEEDGENGGAVEYGPDENIKSQVEKVQDIVKKVMPEPDIIEDVAVDETAAIPAKKYKEDLGIVIPYGDGPHQDEPVAENVYMSIISHASRYVYIMTPYLMLSDEMARCICYAAKSGVDVRIILPHIPDKKAIFAITRSHYQDLMAAGVGIYEYTPGFIHAKVVLSDDVIGTVGTINFDFRSLFLHYECGCLIYRNPELEKIKEDFDKTFAESMKMDWETYKKIPAFQRLCGWVLNLLAPLL